jgi:cytochrome c553
MSCEIRRPLTRERKGRVVQTPKLCYAAFAALCLAGCGQRWWVCEEAPEADLARLPMRLSQTGLFSDLTADALADGVLPYRPRFELWSDGAIKRRWLRVPKGAQIDSRDMDNWIFPEGTQLWKEFTREGIRVETRLLQKLGPADDDWVGQAYLWAEDQHDAYALPYGAIDAQGTKHNVPAASECMACHGGTKSRVLGVSALQLGHDDSSQSTLTLLVELELLSEPPSELVHDLPGDATQQAALGYLHANCAHCHNGERPATSGARCFDPENVLDFKLSLDQLSDVQDTATYRTTGSVVKAGRPGESRLVEMMSDRGFFTQMPPLASESVDREALAIMRRWIEEM